MSISAVKMPHVAIITVNFNGVEDTLELLKSLSQLSHPNYSVWVVDNGSTQDCSSISELFPAVNLIKSAGNLGFAGGNNLAIAKAEADYYLLLNNDTIVKPGFLEPLVMRADSRKQIGIVSPKIMYGPDFSLIQYAGYTELSAIAIRGFALGSGKPDDGSFNKATETARAHGAGMLIKKSVIDQIGPLPEMYFLYYEEMDFSAMATAAGFQIWFEPASVLYHKESSTVGKSSITKTYFLNRARLIYARRNRTGFTKLLSLLYISIVAFPKEGLTHLLAGRFGHVKALFRAIWWNITHSVQK